MAAKKTTYNTRVPEQFKEYSPVNNASNVPDLEHPGIPKNIGPSTEYDQRETHIRRDVDSQTISETHRSFTDATEALIKFIRDIIKPTVVVNGEIKSIPVMYVSAEKWASVQQYGFMRDEQGKVMAPIISIRRTNFDNSEISRLAGVRAYGNESSYYTSYSQLNRYDNFNILNNQIPRKEIYSVSVPEWWKIEYEVIIWTELITHIDKLIEDFYYYRGVPVGGINGIKYAADITSLSTPEITNETGEDKLVKCNLTFEMKVPIIPLKSTDEVNSKREISIGRIVFKEEKVVM
jgi:hypothetical protein